MNPLDELQCLEAYCQFMDLSHDHQRRMSDRLSDDRKRRMREAAHRCLRARCHELAEQLQGDDSVIDAWLDSLRGDALENGADDDA